MFHVSLKMVANICIFKQSSINNKSKNNKFETYIFLKENIWQKVFYSYKINAPILKLKTTYQKHDTLNNIT